MKSFLQEPAHLGWAILAVLGLVVIAFVLAAGWFSRHRTTVNRWTGRARQFVARFPLVTAARRRYPRAWGFVAARISRQEYLGLHLTVGLLVSLAALAGFVAIVEDVADREEVALLDDIVLSWLRTHVTPSGLELMNGVSILGDPITVALLAAIVGAILFWKGERVLLAAWIAALAGGGLLDWLLKQLFQRARPDGAQAFLDGHSWSFPSGHAMGSLVAYGMLAYLACLRFRAVQARIGAIGLAVALVIVIGCTRLYLGVHYFTDVIGGFAAGLVWLAACISGAEIARRRRNLRRSTDEMVVRPSNEIP